MEKAGELLLSGRKPESSVVVFPGKRPGHFLRRYLAEKTGSALRAPAILSMDGFIDLAADELGVKGREASRLDLAWLLYDRLKGELCRVIGRGPGELSLEALLPWALKLIGDFEELRIELKTPKDLSAYDSILPRDLKTESFMKKLESFSRLYGDFYDAAGKEGLLTRSMKYASVAAGIGGFDSGKYENIIFAGLFALTNSEKAVLKHLASRGARIVLEPGPGLAGQFAFLEGSARALAAERQVSPKKIFFYRAPDAHGEVFSLARALKNPAAGDVIVLPESRTLFPLLENALPAACDYNVSMGYPITATPVYGLLDALGDLLDRKGEAGYFAPNYLKFVFHPYVKNICLDGSAETSRVIFQTAEERLSERFDKYVTLREMENDEGLLKDAAAKLKDYGQKPGPAEIKAHLAAVHRALIEPFERLNDIADFAQKLLGFISFISQNSTAPLHPYWAPFVEKVLEHILELKNSSLAAERFDGAAGYFKLLKTFLQEAAYPFPGTPLKGLQVLGLLETRGLRFRRVFFLDANADVLPAAQKEDTILSHFVRESLGLSTYKTRERLARYYFGALLSGADEAHLFYKDSADQERSPFVEKLAWDLEKKGGKPDEREVHLRINFSQAEPGPVKKTTELVEALKNREFSPSALDTYLNCGLKFYYQYGLGLREKEEVSGEIEQREIGVVVHDALEAFFRGKTGAPLNITEADYGRILKAAGGVFDEKLKDRGSGFEYLIRKQVERRLADILDYHRGKLSGVTVLACETELETELVTRHGAIKLKGRADRVDLRGGTVCVVDYKTGSAAAVPSWERFNPAARGDWPKTLKSVQLPFYVLAYMAENGIRDASAMDASLMLLGAENITEEALYKPGRSKAPDKAEVLEKYRLAITSLIEEILDAGRPFAPPHDESPCEGCRFRPLCGRQWVE